MNHLIERSDLRVANLFRRLEKVNSLIDKLEVPSRRSFNGQRFITDRELSERLRVSKRTLQRYRSDGKLPYFMIGHKTYYKVNDVRVFVHTYMDYWASQEFDKKHPKEENKDEK